MVSATFADYHAVRRSFSLEKNLHSLPENIRIANHKIFVDSLFTSSLDAGLQCRHERLINIRVTPCCTADGVCTAVIAQD